MLNRFDAYPIHQTPEPIAHPVSGNRNVYDRYFFNGYDRDGELYFGVAMGLYPNRRVLDASFSVIRDGVQHSIHASRLAPDERTETCAGPISIEVLEPMRAVRVRVAANDAGLEADLVFRARTPAVEEPRFVHPPGPRVAMDSTRFTQFGAWEGSLRVAGTSVEVEPARVLGCRDRSWGVRPVGERDAAGPPGETPQFFWLWAPLHFDDVCTHFGLNEYGDGRPWHRNGCVIRTFDPDRADASPADPEGIEPAADIAYEIVWRSGTRRAESARLTLVPREGEPQIIDLEPILTFQMLGLGYLHPEWGHGVWKGTEAVAAESWALADLDPLDPRHIHVQQLCRARMGRREGIGILEQLVLGPHAPSGFKDLFDGAP